MVPSHYYNDDGDDGVGDDEAMMITNDDDDNNYDQDNVVQIFEEWCASMAIFLNTLLSCSEHSISFRNNCYLLLVAISYPQRRNLSVNTDFFF